LFQFCGRMLFSQLQQPHTASVSLLLNSAGGQDRINHLPCVDPDRICPSAETVTIPFQILLMVWRHTNLESSKWGGIFTDDQMAAAMIDRLVHQGHLLIFEGKSYRMEHALMREMHDAR